MKLKLMSSKYPILGMYILLKKKICKIKIATIVIIKALIFICKVMIDLIIILKFINTTILKKIKAPRIKAP